MRNDNGVKSDIDVKSQFESAAPSKLEQQSEPADQQTSASQSQANTSKADEVSSDNERPDSKT